MKKLASWNVNGIRACVKKGFVDWLTSELPDIVCLQEIKAMPEQFPPELKALNQYNFYIAPAKRPGYSGTAILTKQKPKKIKIGLDIKNFDDEGRTIIAYYEKFTLINCYFPNGQRDHKRVPFKLKYCEAILDKLNGLLKRKKPTLICGDFNTAHTELDLANPKTNTKTTGFLPSERAWHDRLVESGHEDYFRQQHPGENGHYTWWTYRGDCRARNVGWRIDYFYGNPYMKKMIKSIEHRPEVMGSDHCPIILNLK